MALAVSAPACISPRRQRRHTLREETSSAVCSRVSPEIWSTIDTILGSVDVEFHRLEAGSVVADDTPAGAANLTVEAEVRARRAQHREARTIGARGGGNGLEWRWGGWWWRGTGVCCN